jgi:hypothetical protein
MRILRPRSSGVEPAIAGMDPRCQILVLENDFEHISQLSLLVSGKTGHKSLMMLTGSLSDSSKCAFAIGGQVKRVEPAITL